MTLHFPVERLAGEDTCQWTPGFPRSGDVLPRGPEPISGDQVPDSGNLNPH